jgi:gliding motility-associated-like protein
VLKTFGILFCLLLFTTVIFSQPGNDNCNGAVVINPNGSCNAGTTAGANDSWQGSVGCQGGGNHPDVWYSFTSTGSQAQFAITSSAPWTGNIELILAQGTCAGGFNIIGSQCGPSVLNATFNGLQVGAVYFFTISNVNNGTQGPFQVCLNSVSPPTIAGQDCSNAAILCNGNSFSQPTSNAGFGAQEVSTANSCWVFGGERQSKWFKFTIGCTGTLQFNINPVNSNDDYDWAIWNITGDPNNCTTKGNAIACNWSGCKGSTGLSSCISSEPGSNSSGAGCAGTFAAWVNTTAGNNTPITVAAGNTYALLVDNFTASNSGFSLTFGGACSGGTAKIGPDAAFSFSAGTCGTYNFNQTCQTTNSTFLWQFGDGNTSTSQNPSHTYTTFGNFTISLQVTDALGCVATFSQTININASITPSFNAVAAVCSGGTLSPLPTTSTNGITGTWSPALNNTTTTTYTFTPNAGQCATTTTLTITVNPSVTPGFNAVPPICSGATLSPLPTTSTNGITGTWSPALNNTTTTTYTFTPNAGQCATTTTLTITVNPVLSATINCGTSTTSSVLFTWAAVSGATGYTVSYQVNGGPVVNVGAIGNVLNYQVTGLSGGDNVSITVTPTGGAGSCFSAATTTCIANACTPPTANISYAGSFCANVSAPQAVSLTGTGTFTGGTYSSTPGLTLNTTTGDIVPATSTPGIYTVTYTVVASGGCPGVTATTSVTINAIVIPAFNPVTPICSGGILSPLSTISTNGINGTWSPALNNTTTTTYTFTPTAGQCATTTTLTITVNPNVTPSFNAVPPICSGATLSPLPTTSTNGITGTWSPALNNTTTTTYTFTPTAGQCATTTTLTITVNVIQSVIINCGVSTPTSVMFTWTAVNGATAYNVSYQINAGPIINVGPLGALSYPVFGLSAGDNVTITVIPTPGTNTCFSPASATCIAAACTPPTANISYAGPFCANLSAPQAVSLTGTGSFTGGTYSSTPGLTLNSTTGAIVPVTSTPGIYTVTYTVAASGGCPGVTATTSITISAVVIPTFNAVVPICSGGTLAPLPTTSINGINGAWLPALNNTTTTIYTFTAAAGQCATNATLTITVKPNSTSTTNQAICTNQLPYTWNGQTYTAAGTFSVTLINGAGCDSIATLNLSVNSTLTSTTNRTICTNQLPYTWNGQTYTAAGTYSVTLVSISGCDSVATLVLSIGAAPNLVVNDPAIVCQPQTADLTAAPVTAGSDPGLSYTYWSDAAATIPLATANAVSAAGTYYIKGQTAGGCSSIRAVTVSIEAQINNIRYPAVTAIANTPLQLNARNLGTGYSYSWSPVIGLDLPNSRDPMFSNGSTVEYLIMISSPAGCITVDTLLVKVGPGPIAAEPDIFVPKAWSPNGDGHNDFLFPILVNITTLKYFRIYNRWGQKVFETNLPGMGWGGIYHNKKLPPDAYTWIAEGIGVDGKPIKRFGKSLLLR